MIEKSRKLSFLLFVFVLLDIQDRFKVSHYLC